MILIGLGGNLATAAGPPRETILASVEALRAGGIGVSALSPLYASAPVGPADQPRFVNAVAALDCDLPPHALLDRLQAVEQSFGRRRNGRRWQARGLDLDLLDWHGQVRPDPVSWRALIDATSPPEQLALPHPRLHLRRFVLLPLIDIAAGWRHPVLGTPASDLLERIEGQDVERL